MRRAFVKSLAACYRMALAIVIVRRKTLQLNEGCQSLKYTYKKRGCPNRQPRFVNWNNLQRLFREFFGISMNTSFLDNTVFP
jgi:hypothetical protein